MITDPIKELNNESYFNSVSLKSRYQLLNLNQQNEKGGFETGSHWVKYTPYPFLDNDIKYNKYTSSKHSIKELNSENSDIYNKIKKTGIMNYLNTIDQTNSLSDEIMKIKKRPKRDYFYTQCQKIEEKRKKNESLLFEKLYDKSRNKPIKKIQISNLNINDYNDSNRIVTDKSNQDTIEKTFSNPKPNYLRKNSKSQKFTIVVRNLDNHLKPTRLTKKTLKCLEPDKMPKMSMIKFDLLPKFNLDDGYEEEKGKNKLRIKPNINKFHLNKGKNKKKTNLINIEFSIELENNLI